jgi:hypothetical protein
MSIEHKSRPSRPVGIAKGKTKLQEKREIDPEREVKK